MPLWNNLYSTWFQQGYCPIKGIGQFGVKFTFITRVFDDRSEGHEEVNGLPRQIGRPEKSTAVRDGIVAM